MYEDIAVCYESSTVSFWSEKQFERHFETWFNMGMARLSKQQLAGKLAKETLTLDEKIKFLDFAKKIQNLDVGN